MREDAPFDPCFAVREAFASKGLAEVGVLEDADARFGAAAAFLQEAEAFVFELFAKSGHGARADGVDDAELFEVVGGGGEPSSLSGLLNSPMPRGWKSGWPTSRHTTANTIPSNAIGAALKNHGTAICSTV